MKQLIIPYLILVFILTSCQKEISIESAITTNPITLNDSTLISKYIEIDTTAIASLDTISRSLFTYDNLKRITNYDYIAYSNGIITNPPNLRFWNKYFYNANDSLPYIEIDSTNEGGLITAEIIFHTYQNGKLVTDSSYHSSNNSEVHKYYYLQTKIIDSITSYDPLISSPIKGDYRAVYIQKVNGNLITQKDTLFHNYYSTYPTISYIDTLVRNYSIIYDAGNNAFIKFNYMAPYYADNFLIVGTLGNNNPTDTQEVETDNIGTNNQNYHYISSYEYKPNGYPKISRVIDQITPTNTIKAFYFYTN